jgi:hypothetical protein
VPRQVTLEEIKLHSVRTTRDARPICEHIKVRQAERSVAFMERVEGKGLLEGTHDKIQVETLSIAALQTARRHWEGFGRRPRIPGGYALDCGGPVPLLGNTARCRRGAKTPVPARCQGRKFVRTARGGSTALLQHAGSMRPKAHPLIGKGRPHPRSGTQDKVVRRQVPLPLAAAIETSAVKSLAMWTVALAAGPPLGGKRPKGSFDFA